MQNLYGEERTTRYIKGNTKADQLADIAISQENIYTPLINRYYNKYVLVSTRKKKSKKNPENIIINTRTRQSLKNIIRDDYIQNHLQKVDIMK